jgi:parallel beta-helix repeat protein
MAVLAVVGVVSGAPLGTTGTSGSKRSTGALLGALTSPGPLVCGNASLLSGPASPPAGAVTIPAGDDVAAGFANSDSLSPNTTYWFAPGDHTLESGEYNQLTPQSGDTFTGGPGAVLDGQGVNMSAFGGGATDVTIEYLTIEHFALSDNGGQMTVNHDGGANWTIEDDTVENDGGAGVGLGSNDVVTDNCLTDNSEYGFSSFGGSTNVTLTDNEISYNASATPGGNGCGCAGGGKFWDTTNAVVTGNYVHNNGDVGIWVDTDNAGFDISDNYISDNWNEGIQYEISYNALISDNTLVDNAWGGGPTLSGFPDSAIYISESGGDSRIASNYSGSLDVTDNLLTDNWGGVVLWENANRFCGDGSDHLCTLVDPSVYTLSTCPTHLSESSPIDYSDNCRWKTQNVTVSDNTFSFDPADIAGCTATAECGFNGLFSNYGSTAPYTGPSVPNNISNKQSNHFADNTYSGPWQFEYFNQGDVATAAQWAAGLANVQGTGDGFGAQDPGSTFRVAGSDAVGTAIATSQEEFPSASSAKGVVLARSDFFSDALAGGPLAAAIDGPLLITPGAALASSLDPRVQAEIERVLPSGRTVYILGGDLALSANIDTALEGLGYKVVREAGDDEYATAVDVAQAIATTGWGRVTTVFEATGTNFYDALSAVPAAIKEHGAILLTDGAIQAPETAAYLAEFPGDTRYAIGGSLAASGADPTATPVYGQDLYATSAAVANFFFPGASIFGAATSVDFPDALGGGVFMATGGREGPVLLVNPTAPLPAEITPYLASLAMTTYGFLFGGSLAVGADVLSALQAAIG